MADHTTSRAAATAPDGHERAATCTRVSRRGPLVRRVLGLTAGAIIVVVAARSCSGSRVTTSLVDGTPVTASVELPAELCGWYFIARVHVDGAGPFNMMLDTGMRVTQITPEAAESAGVGGAIRELRLGDLVLEGRIPCTVRRLDAISRGLGRPIDGVIAHDVFAHVLLTYDYPGESVRVAPGRLDPGGAGTIETGRGPRPFVRMTVADRTVEVLIDTGSSRGLTLRGLDSYELSAGPTA